MYFYVNLFISICVALLYVYYESNDKIKIKNSCYDTLILAIGILSAKENFVLREAIRSTWLKEYLPHKNNTIKGWFVVGKGDCNIPPEYRLSKYGCSKWNINISKLSEEFYTSHGTHAVTCSPRSKQMLKQGYSFKVNHAVIVKRLGILYDAFVPYIETKIAVLDSQTKDIIVETKITQNSSYFVNGFVYEDVENVLLPKNYEGMVLVEGYLQHETCSDIVWNDGGGVITFNRIYSTPSHADSIKFISDIYSAASIQFMVHDLNSLKIIMSQEDTITSKWLLNQKSVNEKLLIESKKKQDILFVNVTETYRNLPMKLLQFYKWIDQNYKPAYVMKSDDDTVIDISRLVLFMKNHLFKSDEQWIWSRFRTDWPVNYIGKWADYDYKSSLYPSFPCGAAYLISSKILKWLSLNAEYLFPYQGEDVSIGIWLSAINPNFIDDPDFECDSACNQESYNRAQLTVDQIYEIWEMYKKCKNLCSCS